MKLALFIFAVLAAINYCWAGHQQGYGHGGTSYQNSHLGQSQGHGHGHGHQQSYGHGQQQSYGHGQQQGHGHGGYQKDYYARPYYKYSYGVNDHYTYDQKHASEHRDGENVKGHYSLREPDGSWRTVNYVADYNGFRANVYRTPNTHAHGHGQGHGHQQNYH